MSVIEAIAKFGLSGGLGALIGIVAVWWVEPTTSEGTTLVLTIPIICSVVVGGIASYLLGSKEDATAGAENSAAQSKRVRAVRAGFRKRPARPKG